MIYSKLSAGRVGNAHITYYLLVNYLQQIKDYAVGLLPKGLPPHASTVRSYVQTIGFVPRPAGQNIFSFTCTRFFSLDRSFYKSTTAGRVHVQSYSLLPLFLKSTAHVITMQTF